MLPLQSSLQIPCSVMESLRVSTIEVDALEITVVPPMTNADAEPKRVNSAISGHHRHNLTSKASQHAPSSPRRALVLPLQASHVMAGQVVSIVSAAYLGQPKGVSTCVDSELKQSPLAQPDCVACPGGVEMETAADVWYQTGKGLAGWSHTGRQANTCAAWATHRNMCQIR